MIHNNPFLFQTQDPKVLNEVSWNEQIDKILMNLSEIYDQCVEPVEARFRYKNFDSFSFRETLNQRTPLVTLLGPFSSGKSSIINYLVQHEVLATGPQPVTDKFTVLSYGEKLEQMSGKILLEDPKSIYHGLLRFGKEFSECFTSILIPHPLLRSFSLIDTPGMLEASTKNHTRRYDYADVIRWFAEKSDLILFLFDPTKLDAGLELQSVFNTSLRKHYGKMRIILNKADSVSSQELLRVYGALFWNLSNLLRMTEPPRVYVCSLWDRPYAENTDHVLFESEKVDLLCELLQNMPAQTIDQRITNTLRRARDVWIFAMICATYRSHLPVLIGKKKAKEHFFENYTNIIKVIAEKYSIFVDDFPSSREIRAFLEKVDSSDFPKMEAFEKSRSFTRLNEAIQSKFPALFQPITQHLVADPRDRKRNLRYLLNYNMETDEKKVLAWSKSEGADKNPLVLEDIHSVEEAKGKESSLA